MAPIPEDTVLNSCSSTISLRENLGVDVIRAQHRWILQPCLYSKPMAFLSPKGAFIHNLHSLRKTSILKCILTGVQSQVEVTLGDVWLLQVLKHWEVWTLKLERPKFTSRSMCADCMTLNKSSELSVPRFPRNLCQPHWIAMEFKYYFKYFFLFPPSLSYILFFPLQLPFGNNLECISEFILKSQIGNIWGCVSVTQPLSQPLCCWKRENRHKRINKWVWLPSNKTLLIKSAASGFGPGAVCSLLTPGLDSSSYGDTLASLGVRCALQGDDSKTLLSLTPSPYLPLANDGNSLSREMHKKAAQVSKGWAFNHF